MNLIRNFSIFRKAIIFIRNIRKFISKNLNSGGLFIVDFLNHKIIRENIIENEEKIIEGIKFKIHRYIKNSLKPIITIHRYINNILKLMFTVN